MYGLAIPSQAFLSPWVAALAESTTFPFRFSVEVHLASSDRSGLCSTELQWPVSGQACRVSHFAVFSIQSDAIDLGWIGGQCMTILLRSLAPSYRNLPNSMPASSGTTTRDFVSFFLFILLHIPCVWQPPHKIRHLFSMSGFSAPL